MGVNKFTIKNSDGNEDHQRENLNHLCKHLNRDEQTLSSYMDVKGAAGEDQEEMRNTTLETKEMADSYYLVAELYSEVMWKA